jgi:hypothetical protein
MVIGGKVYALKKIPSMYIFDGKVIVYILFQLPVDDSFNWVSLDDPSGVGRGGGEGQGE